MTLLVSWIGVDTHGPSSAYIATDSRITWDGKEKYKFDNCRKIFSFKQSADIVGYCGDVLFPSIVLSQAVEMADTGFLFQANEPPQDRFSKISRLIKTQFDKYPFFYKNTVSIVHIARDYKKPSFEFRLLEWKKI